MILPLILKSIPKFLFITLVAAFCFLILYQAGWTWGDDYEFIRTTVIGKVKPPAVYPEMGRFYPLGHIEYNLFLPFGDQVQLYFVWLVLKLLLLAYLCKKIIAEIFHFSSSEPPEHFQYLALLTLFFCSSFIEIYSQVIYAEASLIITLVATFYFYLRARRTSDIINYFYSFCCAVLSTYLKEPVILVFTVFPLAQMFFLDRKCKLSAKYYYSALLINSLIYILIYLLFITPKVDVYYHQGRDLAFTYGQHIYAILLANPILLYPLFLIIGFPLIRKFKLWHAGLYALIGSTYILTYLYLRLSSFYLIVPGYILIFISLCYIFGSLQSFSSGFNVSAKLLFISIYLLCLINGVNQNIEALKWRLHQRQQMHATISFFRQIKANNFAPVYLQGPKSKNNFMNILEQWRFDVVRTIYAYANNDWNSEGGVSLKNIQHTEALDPRSILILGRLKKEDIEKKFGIRLKFLGTISRLKYYTIKKERTRFSGLRSPISSIS